MEKLLPLSIKCLLVVYPLDSFSEALIEVTLSGSSTTFSESHWLCGPSPVSGISPPFYASIFLVVILNQYNFPPDLLPLLASWSR